MRRTATIGRTENPGGTGALLLGPCETPAFRHSRFGAPFGAVPGRIQRPISALPRVLDVGPSGKKSPESRLWLFPDRLARTSSTEAVRA